MVASHVLYLVVQVIVVGPQVVDLSFIVLLYSVDFCFQCLYCTFQGCLVASRPFSLNKLLLDTAIFHLQHFEDGVFLLYFSL